MNMKKIESEINYEATIELTSKMFKLYLSILIIAVLGFGILLTLSFIYNLFQEIYFLIILFVLILLLIVSTFYVVTLTIARNRSKNAHIKLTYNFEVNHMTISTLDENGKKKQLVVKYHDIAFYKESKHYLFFYLDLRNAFPLRKDDNINQVAQIMNLTNIKRKVF